MRKVVPPDTTLMYNQEGVVTGYTGRELPEWVKVDETVLSKVNSVAISKPGKVQGDGSKNVDIKTKPVRVSDCPTGTCRKVAAAHGVEYIIFIFLTTTKKIPN